MEETFNPALFYNKELSDNKLIFKKLEQKTRFLSYTRIFSFILAIILIYPFADSSNYLWLAGSIILFAVFILAVITHSKIFKKLNFIKNKILVIENELNTIELKPQTFSDGEIFKKDLPFADDLDLFGKNSLFHLLNRCSTTEGEARLAASLTKVNSSEQIKNQQNAVRELSLKHDFRIDFITRLFGSKQKIRDLFLQKNVQAENLFSGKFYKIGLLIFPVLMAASILFWIFSGNYSLTIVLGTVGLFLVGAKAKQVGKLAEEVSGQKQMLKIWSEVMHLFSVLPVESEMLSEMQSSAKNAAIHFKQLSRISERFDRRGNLLWFTLANFLYIYDFQVVRQYHIWKNNHADSVHYWIDNLANLEMLVSYGCFAANHQDYHFPQLSDSLMIDAKHLGHPLINPSENVKNDIQLSLSPRLMLVTGSNMSGKSTWLRTVGVNVLLAQAGAPVCAERFLWKPVLVLSSLRQSDSLAESTSLFMNELKQLKHILSTAETGVNCLILLDEILRGTNSDDKFFGSHALIKKLSQMNSLTIMATHDLKLSELENDYPEQIVNYCFESELIDNQLTFNYLIRKGVAINRNATWLMRNMGII